MWYKQNQTVRNLLRLSFVLNIIPLTATHAVLHQYVIPFYHRLVFHGMDVAACLTIHPLGLTIYPLKDIWVVSSLELLTNKSAMNIPIWVLNERSFISLRWRPKSTTAGLVVYRLTMINTFEPLGSKFLKQGGQTQQGRSTRCCWNCSG